MKTIRDWIKLSATLGAAVILLAMFAGQARAANYNIILKDQSGTPLNCAIGGFGSPTEFGFAKTINGSFAPANPSITIDGTCGIAGLPAPTTFNQNSTLGVWVLSRVENKPGTGCAPPNYDQPDCKLENLNQGPNVEGLGGLAYPTLPSSGSLKTVPNVVVNGAVTTTTTYEIVFTYNYVGTPNNPVRTYSIVRTVQVRINGNPGPTTSTTLATGQYYLRNINHVPEPESLLLLLTGLAGLIATHLLKTRRQ